MTLSKLLLALLPAALPATAALQYRGVDWSSVIAEERTNGVKYRNAQGLEMPLENILVDAGVNMVRQRVWTVEGDYGIQYNLALAQRAAAAGLMFGLNLHYSDTWTNPGMQAIPTGWPEDLEALEKQVYTYTFDLCETFAAAGLYPEMITIGNEIVGGMLWPTGYTDKPDNLARLLKAGSSAIRASSLGRTTKILTHLAHGYDQELQNWFYQAVTASGVFTSADWDVIAVSFYPFWGEGATMEALRRTLSDLNAQYDKEVQVVETNWPTQCTSPEYPFPSDQLGIPFSPAGQYQYIELLASTLDAIPGASGLNYWEPAWVNNVGLGSPCESNIMFDQGGNAYDSLGVFQYI